MNHIHIHAPKGEYIAQIRGRGCRLWDTVGEPFTTAKEAMCAAVNALEERHLRARVLFCTEWYDPIISMELKK